MKLIDLIYKYRKAVILMCIAEFLYLIICLTAIHKMIHGSSPIDTLFILQHNIGFWLLLSISPISMVLGLFALKKYDNKINHINDLIHECGTNLENVVAFTAELGKENYRASIDLIGDNNHIRKALETVRENLIRSNKEEKDRQWIMEGINHIGNVLRENNNSRLLSYGVLSYVVNVVNGAVQGAFYETSGKMPKDLKLKMISSYAYGRKKYLQEEFGFAQGLVGQAAAEMQTIYRTEIPADYVTITSGLIQDNKPTSLLLVPLIDNDNLMGVMEFASLTEFSTLQIHFIEELSSIIARALYNIKTNEITRKLLEESRVMTENLKGQQEQLNQNAEEMKATQEELEKSNEALETKIQEVENIQKKQNVLLENASEIISVYDENRTVIYESPSVKAILGYNPEEIVGGNSFSRVHPMGIKAMEEMFDNLLKFPDKTQTVQIIYMKKGGDRIWIEATGRNFLNDPAIKGIVLNSRDITQQRKAEQEQVIRGKMQALSENSEDLILRLTLDLDLQYVNPMLEALTGVEKSSSQGSNIRDINLSDELVQSFEEIISNVKQTGSVVKREINFPSIQGKVIMATSAIPEFDKNKNLETILVVLHDITQRKMEAVMLEETNKKIRSSINYARRIQNAIIPKQDEIAKDLPNSAILYKPKDVVSGDFPYYYKKDGYLYYAAVDCTGHGVPGAMMSLIGHLLLNDLLNDQGLLEPGEVLNRLHHRVVKTLKQDDPKNKAADGMDIALCRISEDLKEVLYAGAHRPLFHFQKGELLQYKGDKYPIGGNQYNGKNHFTTHKVDIKKGDSIYFFSDGYPDQFGGPENLKYGAKRMKQLITENSDKSVESVVSLFQNSYSEWKQNQRQIDDILLIGIGF